MIKPAQPWDRTVGARLRFGNRHSPAAESPRSSSGHAWHGDNRKRMPPHTVLPGHIGGNSSVILRQTGIAKKSKVRWR